MPPPDAPSAATIHQGPSGPSEGRTMTPLRGFLFSFTAGLALLISGHGLMRAAFSDSPFETSPANLSGLDPNPATA